MIFVPKFIQQLAVLVGPKGPGQKAQSQSLSRRRFYLSEETRTPVFGRIVFPAPGALDKNIQQLIIKSAVPSEFS